MDLEQGFDLADVVRIVKRRATVIWSLTLGVFLLSVFVAAVLPDRYVASATLLVEPQTISERLVESGLTGRDINSRLHLIQMQILSRGRLTRVIDDLKLYPEESKKMTREEVIEMMRSRISLVPVLPELQEELLTRQRQIEINTFVLSFQHKKPQTAAAVTNRLANDFIDEHIKERVEISGDTSEFIEAELNRLAQRIGEVESRIAAVKTENAGRLPEDFGANQRLMERALEGVRAAERDLATAESDESFFRQQAMLSVGVGDTVETSPGRRLELLEIQLNEYRSRGFTEKHPDMIAARGEMEALRAQLTGEQLETEEPVAVSLAQQSAMAERERASLRVASARAEIQRLANQAAEIEARMAATPRVAEQLAALEREHRHLFESYQEFSDKRLEAGVAADMERRQKGEQFRVLEAAYPPPAPASPNRPMILVLGLLLGLALGGAGAILLELGDSSFHAARSLQDALRIPVLAAVPTVMLAADRKARRRRRVRRMLAAVTVTGVVLVASVIGNWRVNGTPDAVKTLIGGGQDAAAASSQSERG